MRRCRGRRPARSSIASCASGFRPGADLFNILAPIFGLIALAYASRRVNILGPNAYLELNRFVASLALPALIFDNVAHVRPEQLHQPGFAAAFGLGALVVFA